MSIQAVSISEYRNIKELTLNLGPRANLFTGLNGQGKTNLLEAIFFALRGTSFRTDDYRDLINKGADSNQVATRVFLDIQRDHVRDSVQATIFSNKKSLRLNQKPVSAQKLVTQFPMVIFTPDSLSAIKSGPEPRRELMNEILVLHNPLIHQLIHDYSRALRARNRYLKSLLDAQSSKVDAELLAALSEGLFKLATELTWARIEMLRAIRPVFRKVVSELFKHDKFEADIDYLISASLVRDYTRSGIEDLLSQRRIELYDAELASGTTLWGPHRHDLFVTCGGNEARHFCSQGQQRALILALKISQIVHHFESYGKYPLLLLDDVFSELDRDRRTHLLDFLSGIKTQSILTSTDVENLGQARGLKWESCFDQVTSFYEVSKGLIYRSEINQVGTGVQA